MLPTLRRIPQVRDLIDQKAYFVVPPRHRDRYAREINTGQLIRQ